MLENREHSEILHQEVIPSNCYSPTKEIRDDSSEQQKRGLAGLKEIPSDRKQPFVLIGEVQCWISPLRLGLESGLGLVLRFPNDAISFWLEILQFKIRSDGNSCCRA